MQTTDISVTALSCQEATHLAHEVCVSELLKGGGIKLAIGLLSIGLAACSNLSPEPRQPSQDNGLVMNEIDQAIADVAKRVSNAEIRLQVEILKNRGTDSQKAGFIAGAQKYRDIARGGATYSLPKSLEVFLPTATRKGQSVAVGADCIHSPPSCVYVPVCIKYSPDECIDTLYHKLCTQASDSCFDSPGRSSYRLITQD